MYSLRIFVCLLQIIPHISVFSFPVTSLVSVHLMKAEMPQKIQLTTISGIHVPPGVPGGTKKDCGVAQVIWKSGNYDLFLFLKTPKTYSIDIINRFNTYSTYYYSVQHTWCTTSGVDGRWRYAGSKWKSPSSSFLKDCNICFSYSVCSLRQRRVQVTLHRWNTSSSQPLQKL